MSKPTLASARWADLGSNNIAPSSGQRDSGWLNGASIVSSYFNALLNQAYLWFSFLDPLFNSSGVLLHGTRTRLVGLGGGSPEGTAMVENNQRVIATSQALKWQKTIPMEAGQRILAVRARITDGNDPTAITMELLKRTGGSVAQIGSSAVSAGTGTDQTLAITGLTETVADDANSDISYSVFFSAPSTTDQVTLYSLVVDYDRP